MSAFFGLLNILGGLGVFLFGMKVMSEGIQRRAGGRLRRVLHVITQHPAAAIATGVTVTSIVQSSSATTVLLVSLVNAGLVELEQAIGVIMGANIGTTFTAWLVSVLGFKVKITALALPAVACGLPFLFSKSERRRDIAAILMGFGILFLGLHLMKESVPDIRSHPDTLAFLQHVADHGYASVVLFVAVGTVLTVVVQSSSAAMAITITMAFKGWIHFDTAAALVMGENIGTTVTAYLASLGMNAHAKRAARAHMIFNLLGVAWLLILFYPFLAVVDALVPGAMSAPDHMPFHLSAFHSLFNVTNTLVLVWFIPRMARIVTKLIPEHGPDGPTRLRPIPGNTPEAVESNLISVRAELGRMARIVCDMVMYAMNANTETDTGKMDELTRQVERHEEVTDRMQAEIMAFLNECMVESLTEQQAREIRAQQRIASELENTADSLLSVVHLLQSRRAKGLSFHAGAEEQLVDFASLAMDFLRYNTDYLTRALQEHDHEQSTAMEEAVDRQRDRLRKAARKKIAKGADVRAELIFLDLIKHLEHVGDHCLTISEAIRELKPLDT